MELIETDENIAKDTIYNTLLDDEYYEEIQVVNDELSEYHENEMLTIEQMSGKVKYIFEEYNKHGICDTNGNWTFSKDEWFNPNIYPNSEDTIPVCAQCQSDFQEFKIQDKLEGMEVVLKHPSACLWYRYFVEKIRLNCPSAKIVRSKTRSVKIVR